ncbi:MAG: hypothetical protein HKP55_07525 [Gammaproteobacteria bacterium]|nr:hypothetical protein [Gammaproteobacteria bacterium]NNJ91507.1 hypothetical protein [Gammaproteobacteria bacterium]
MNDKILVAVFLISGLVCITSIIKYVQHDNQKFFHIASISGLVCAASFLWVYYDF